MFSQVFGNNLSVPKVLFRSSRYADLSPSSKLVYSLLLEGLQYCRNRNWFDENGDIYLLLPQEAIGQSLGFKRLVVNRSLKELEKAGLIEMRHQGLCLPNRIYVHEPILREEEMSRDSCQNLLFG